MNNNKKSNLTIYLAIIAIVLPAIILILTRPKNPIIWQDAVAYGMLIILIISIIAAIISSIGLVLGITNVISINKIVKAEDKKNLIM